MKFIVRMISVSLVSLILINISMANDTEGAQTQPSTINEATQKVTGETHKSQRDYVLPFKEDRVEHRKDRRDRKENKRSNANTTENNS
ncbi:hypothetical protein [Francisella frigiditurris]|uniref:Secreted protein n=1 Tax=Francisella frigiditurris TaxID=1542390 RepID=A0A1J0KT20_9GAMM|nr:hypothetical protein [Francisella frigiditurris]APC96831.1 hypothetical protein KX01_394 [Francisella frigiditurris]